MVELAFVLPVFLLLIFGIIYFSIYFYSGQTAQVLAQKAVLAATPVDPAAINAEELIRQRVKQRLTQLSETFPGYIGALNSGGCGESAPGAHVCVDTPGPDRERYHVTVHLVSSFDDIWPGFPDVIGFLTTGPSKPVLIEGNASTDVYGRRASP